jgi:putative metal-binding protein/hemolysin type calcium-binding protein
VSISLSRYLIDLDNPAQVDHLKITSSANGLRIRFENPQGVTVSPDLEPGTCDPDGANAAECGFQAIRTSVSVNVVGKTNPTAPDEIDASTSPRLLRIGDRNPAAAALIVKGSPLNDVITLAPGAGIPFDSSVDAGDGADVVNGSTRRDVIHGGPGNDSLNGLGGNDDLFGDAGADALTGSSGGDVIDGGGDRDGVHYEDHAAGVSVTVGAGAGDDGNASDGAPGARDTVSTAEDVIGTAADDSLSGDGSANALTGGGGNDVLAGGAGDDVLDGGAGANTASFADHAAPVTVNLADPGTDGAAGEHDTLVAIRDLLGGTGDDTLVGDPQANVIRGGAGKDIVIGQSGGDFLFGDTGDDDMRAKDDETDNVDCGDGADKASLDDIDLAVACDDATVTVVDIDGDGAPHALDCDDANPAIRPGAVDVPGDGIDQDCAGGDARVDADGDGIFREQDCDDANPAIKPGAPEVNGNAVDENCDGIRAPFPKLDVGLGQDYRYFDRYTLLTELSAARVPAGATIAVRCSGKGCPFRSRTTRLRSAKRKVSFKQAFKGRHLRKGTIVTLTVRAPGAIGKALVIKVRSPRKPSTKITCVDPAGRTTAC